MKWETPLNRDILLCLFFLFTSAAAAPAQPAPLALVGGTVVHPDGSPSLEDSAVLIEGNRIARVGRRKTVEIPEGAEVIRVDGKWILPGLIDAHIHFFQSGGLYTRPDVIDLRKRVPYEKELARIDADLPDTFARYLRCGITSVADMGGPFWNFTVRDLARKTLAAPRVAVTGPLISTYQPAALTTGDPPILEVKTAREARDLVRRQAEHEPDYIKIWFIVQKGETPAEHMPVIRAVVEESHRRSLRVIVHATELETARAAAGAGIDVLVHSVFDRDVDDAFLDLLTRRNILYIPTLMVHESYFEVLSQQIRLTPAEHRFADPQVISSLFDLRGIPVKEVPERRRGLLQTPRPVPEPEIAMKNLKRVWDAGIPVAMGTDAGNIGTPHAACMYREMELMQKAGLSPRDILRAATLGGARMMGLEKDLGEVKQGMLADLVVLDADPSKDIQNVSRVHLVLKDGKIFRPEALVKETPADIVQREVNAYNARDLEAFVATYSPDVKFYHLGETRPFLTGREEIRKRYADFFLRATKLHCEITSRIVQGNHVIDQEKVTGRPDGKTIHAVLAYEVKDGLINQVWFVK